MSRVCVLGGGAWGSALALHLARKGTDVLLWARRPEVADTINRDPGAGGLRATARADEAVRGCRVVVNAVPSHAIRSVLRSAAGEVDVQTVVVNTAKGIEIDTLGFMSQVVADTLPGRRYVVLSGPSFAAEVREGQPTAVVAASTDPGAAVQVQQLFSTPRFRVYTSDDVVGTEVAGALKNVIAIAAGVLEGLGMGHNPRAALITRGLAELTRLGAALGADPQTFAGLAGVGDLVLTTTGALSRNRALGVALGRGETLASHTQKHPAAVEGVNTARAALALATRVGVELPITAQVAAVLFEGRSPARAVSELMERTLKSEQWT